MTSSVRTIYTNDSGIEVKRCAKCGQEKPATLEFFCFREKGRKSLDSYCRECKRSITSRWISDHQDYMKQKTRQDRRRYKWRALIHYSSNGEKPTCDCCGETVFEFLCIDHVNGGGHRHRESLPTRRGGSFYKWLSDHNWPNGYRVLCHNCNMSLGSYGYCPHKSPEQSEKIDDYFDFGRYTKRPKTSV